MKQIGQVIKTDPDFSTARVRMQRHASCQGCTACKMGSSDKPIEMEALNSIQAQAGNWVEVEMDHQRVLKAAFLMYIIPLVFLVIGILATNFLTGMAGIHRYRDGLTAIGGFVATATAFIILHHSEKRRKYKESMLPVIVSLTAEIPSQCSDTPIESAD